MKELIKQILCRIGIHHWSPWVALDDITVTGWHHHQARHCKWCNRAQRRWEG